MKKVWCVVFASMAMVGVIAMDARSDKQPVNREAVFKVLDQLHEYASKADGARYFALFAPHAVFLGTDATERWTLEQFKTYAQARFETGTGWTYRLIEHSRHVNFAGDVAWFDELLENDKYGTVRGSGVLRKIDDQWKIEQYNLAFTVPNEAAKAVVEVIRQAAPAKSD